MHWVSLCSIKRPVEEGPRIRVVSVVGTPLLEFLALLAVLFGFSSSPLAPQITGGGNGPPKKGMLKLGGK